MKNADEPINPCLIQGRQGFGDKPTISNRYTYGLTKREYFAAMALQGLMVQAIPGGHNSNNASNNKERAKFAVDMADEILKQLEK